MINTHMSANVTIDSIQRLDLDGNISTSINTNNLPETSSLYDTNKNCAKASKFL